MASLCGWLSKCVVRSFSRSLTTCPSQNLLRPEGQASSEVQCRASDEDEDEEVERSREKGTVK
ncbi:hypothetical protein E2C01_071909 [Portunus trituberculatus]|uniref:Uncharacterized protein n=1 Tax=Portunus trituberculatus TaxID=210409 RepID=A0A5B7I5Q3_PORTR|nr:hypothetical protein [Portunus trituberculatus]